MSHGLGPAGWLMVAAMFCSCVGNPPGIRASAGMIVPSELVALDVSGTPVLLEDDKNWGTMCALERQILDGTLAQLQACYETNRLLAVARAVIATTNLETQPRPLSRREWQQVGRLLGRIRGVAKSAEGFCTLTGPHLALVRASVIVKGSFHWVYVLRSDVTPELAQWRMLCVQHLEN